MRDPGLRILCQTWKPRIRSQCARQTLLCTIARSCWHAFCCCTNRGLQLHLLSALGEIWRGGGLPEKEGIKKEFVGLSVVMKTVKGAEGQANLHARRQLEDSGEFGSHGNEVWQTLCLWLLRKQVGWSPRCFERRQALCSCTHAGHSFDGFKIGSTWHRQLLSLPSHLRSCFLTTFSTSTLHGCSYRTEEG